MLFAESIAFS